MDTENTTDNSVEMKETRMKEMVKELYIIYFICTIPMVALTLALYEMFGSQSEPLFEFLRSKIVVNSLFVIGVVSMFWCSYKIYQVIIKAKNLHSEDPSEGKS